MMVPQGSYGILSHDSTSSNVPDRISEELDVRGFAVIQDVLTSQEVDRYNILLDQIYEKQCLDIAEYGELSEISDRDVVRCPLAYDDAFVDLATKKPVLDVARQKMGDSLMLLQQNGIINHPDRVQFQTNWHRDLSYQHWVCSKMICMSALFCLEDFNTETGGTVFLPASHKSEGFPSPQLTKKMEEAPEAPAGSVILFNAMTFHRAGVNVSRRVRRAVNHTIGVPILAQQIDIPSMLETEPGDPWTAQFLGFRWSPASSVTEWRRRKFRALNR